MSGILEINTQTAPGSRSAPKVYSCQLTQNAYITFPDGEILQTAGLGSQWSWPVPPFMTGAASASWIELNFLARPPLTNLEIQLMPVNEVISLYYSLRKVVPPCSIKPDPVISAGLGKFGKDHEFNLQQRIYNNRPDLHQITVGGRTYRILVPPHLLDPPPCPAGMGSGVVGLVGDIVGYFIPIIGWAYIIASTAYQVVDTVSQLKAAGQAAALVSEIQAGITYAKNLIHDPSPGQSSINTLKNNFAAWKARVAQVSPLADSINLQGIHSCSGISALLNSFDSADGAAKYASQWRPYENYFFSQSVYNLCFPTQSLSAISASSVAPAAAGLGLGALLLLLL